MKKLLIAKNRILICMGIVLAIFIISDSCSKSSTDMGTPGANEVWLQNMAFTPSSITVPAGTTVKWTNKDNLTHNVTGSAPGFSSGSLGSGEVFTFQFSTAGSFPYTCTIHPSMAGIVIVQ